MEDKNLDTVLFTFAGFFSIFCMSAYIAAYIYFLVALGKFRAKTKTHKELFPLFKSSRINVINILFWAQLGVVLTTTISIACSYFGYEWTLIDVLSDICWGLVIISIITSVS